MDAVITERKLFSPEEVAESLGVHRNTVYNWIRSGVLAASKCGPRVWRIAAADLAVFVGSR